MNRVLRATLFLTVCAAAFGKPWGIHGPMKQSAGEQSWCKEDKTYRLRYNITAINDDQVLEIEQLTDIEDVSCDIDHTQLQLKFHNEIISNKYALQWKLGGYFLTGGDKYNCAAKAKPGTDMLLRRVVAAQDDGQYVMVHTAPARYDDIYEQADIDFLAEKGGGDCDGSKHICIGLNTDDTCESSAGPIPIYSNQFITLTCSDCFIAFEADVFFSMSIKHWQLQSLTGGFRNGAVHGSIELDLLAQASWSTGIDKTMSLLTHADLVSFHVGPVPFEIWFDSPVELVANVMLHASAEAKAGVAMNWTIGESSISWDPKNHWQHVKPNPSVTFTPTISGSAEFDGSASLALIPGINMHVNDVFRYGLTLNPHLDMQINGDTTSKQICESVTYDVDFTSEAELDINIGDPTHLMTPRVVY